MSILRIFTFAILSLFSINSSLAQSASVKKKQKQIEKTKLQQKKEEEKELKQKIKDHWGLQSKKTQKMMKATAKNAKKFNTQNNRNLLRKVFNRKRKKIKRNYG